MWKFMIVSLTVSIVGCVQEGGGTTSGTPTISVIQVPVGGSGASGAGVSGPNQNPVPAQ